MTGKHILGPESGDGAGGGLSVGEDSDTMYRLSNGREEGERELVSVCSKERVLFDAMGSRFKCLRLKHFDEEERHERKRTERGGKREERTTKRTAMKRQGQK